MMFGIPLSAVGVVVVVVLNLTLVCGAVEIDKNGYIVFCPCMGRFGNQADQFLGALQFAKELKRTLVLPHWVEYPEKHMTSVQIPFDKYFQVEPLGQYTPVILMTDFMQHIAPKVWPVGKRTVFCYGPRSTTGSPSSCNAKEGNPFGPFWDKFNVDFDSNAFYGPLGYNPQPNLKEDWDAKYSPSDYPVLAFTGAPGAFPVIKENVRLQEYLKWSDDVESRAIRFLLNKNKKNEFLIGLHLRNGIDFKRACEHITGRDRYHFFASAQCLGYSFEHGLPSRDLCYPTADEIIKQLGNTIDKYDAKHVYVASDDDYMLVRFQTEFPNVSFFKYEQNSPHVDLNILGKADHAILNCMSTFSAFVKRERDSANKTSEFWSFRPNDRDEL